MELSLQHLALYSSPYSAGIGRTGTFIVIDILIDIIREKGKSSGGQEVAIPVQVCDMRVPGKVARLGERIYRRKKQSWKSDGIHFQ